MKKLTRAVILPMICRRSDSYRNICRDKTYDSKDRLKALGAWNALEELKNSISELEVEK